MSSETRTDKGLQEDSWSVNPARQRLLTLKQAAEYLGRGVWAMRELIYRREIPVVTSGKDGAKQWLDLEDLNAWIEKNKKYA